MRWLPTRRRNGPPCRWRPAAAVSDRRRGRSPTRCGGMPGQRLRAVPHRGRPVRPGVPVLVPQPEVPVQARAGPAAALVRRFGARRRGRSARLGRFLAHRPGFSGRNRPCQQASRPSPGYVPGAAARRAEQRETRVASGLAELDRWLCDQVRQGPAASQQASYAHWDDIAARMVDAQAPGLAERLRALASVPHSGAGWDGRAARGIRAPAPARRRLPPAEARLPPPLRDTVRSRIGFSLRQADVLVARAADQGPLAGAGPARPRAGPDPTRRTWLRGRKTGRDALLLSFAAAGQALDDSLAVGADTDAGSGVLPGRGPAARGRAGQARRPRRLAHAAASGGAPLRRTGRRMAARSPGC
mgnify:CR=1 FL=1